MKNNFSYKGTKEELNDPGTLDSFIRSLESKEQRDYFWDYVKDMIAGFRKELEYITK